jgi:L-ascorbate metabolism protein UlaG (beta-lactamase superfamily)
MQLTKYEHACLTLEKDDQVIVIDPGEFSSDFIAPEHVIGVVITHEHADHFDSDRLAAIIDKNPEAVIVGLMAITSKIEAFETKTVVAGDTVELGSFTLEFFGGEHATIHPMIPIVTNVGVLVNDLLYCPGDSFTAPNRSVDTLAVPIAAPWLKVSEAMDFLTEIRPRLAFPTHDAVLSEVGKEITDAHLQYAANEVGVMYQRLTGSIDI